MQYLIDVIHTSTSPAILLPYSDQYVKNNLLIRTYKKYSFIDTYTLLQKLNEDGLNYSVLIKK